MIKKPKSQHIALVLSESCCRKILLMIRTQLPVNGPMIGRRSLGHPMPFEATKTKASHLRSLSLYVSSYRQKGW